MTRKAKECVVYVIAAILIIIRVDWWWWGKDFKPVLGGWLTFPEIYQLLIWLAGYALVVYTVYGIWQSNDEKGGE